MKPSAQASIQSECRHLACPKCHADFSPEGGALRCTACDFVGRMDNGVVVIGNPAIPSYFDRIYPIMQASNHAPGTWELFYSRQAAAVENCLQPGQLVIDVGCGPEIVYRKNGAFVVGVDASFASIRENRAADIRVFGSAAEMPLKEQSADVVVCFYSVHHMTGRTAAENHGIVNRVFREFARVLKARGTLMIFDVSPRWPFDVLEYAGWNLARRFLGSSLDMYFWKERDLRALGAAYLPRASFELRRFGGSVLTTFPPIFSKPAFRLPRFLYPFDINLYRWQA